MDNIHYSVKRAASYDEHHDKSLRNRLTTWRERQCLRKALQQAHPLSTVLDLPCGTGRFAAALEGIELKQRHVVGFGGQFFAAGGGGFKFFGSGHRLKGRKVNDKRKTESQPSTAWINSVGKRYGLQPK